MILPRRHLKIRFSVVGKRSERYGWKRCHSPMLRFEHLLYSALVLGLDKVVEGRQM